MWRLRAPIAFEFFRYENMDMEPLKPEFKKSVLADNPEAQPGDLEEYERLLPLRFTEDPDQEVPASPVAEQSQSLRQQREERIQELHQKLFKSAAETATSVQR
jgi:hypothetical protein